MKLQKTLSIILLASTMALFAFPAMAKDKKEAVVFTTNIGDESLVGEYENLDTDYANELVNLFYTPALSIDWTTNISIELRGRELIRKSRI